ncbi:hypothetical protein [Litorivivens sp.]|uniref:hypothetical protein n=1 Tax=Litorivivens sp. TaxID=2020868 RepID=UPI003565A213
MSELFDVAIVAQDYPPAVLQRLASLLGTSPAKLARALRKRDLIVKKDQDEAVAQRYAILIYEKTGAEAIVVGGPDLHAIPASDKPKATKADASTKGAGLNQRWLSVMAVSVLLGILALFFFIQRDTPLDAALHLQTALETGNSSELAQHVSMDALWLKLKADVSADPELSKRFATSLSSQASLESIATLWLQSGATAGAPPLMQVLLRALAGVAQHPEQVALMEEERNSAVITSRFTRPDLDLGFQPQWRMERRGDHWAIAQWLNAVSLLTTVDAAETQTLIAANQRIHEELAGLVGEFSYQHRITGVHRFSLGQLRINATIVNGSHQSLQTLSGKLFVYGVQSKQVYASKPFQWHAKERVTPPGGSVSVEVFFSLDEGWPELIKAIERNTEALEVGYAISSASYRTGEVIKPYANFAELQAATNVE